MKRKLVIATLALAVVFSSVISVAAVSALLQEKSRYNFERTPQYARALRTPGSVARAQALRRPGTPEYALAVQVQEQPAAPPEGPAAPAPRQGRRGAPPPSAPIPINAPQDTTVVTTRDGQTVVLSRGQAGEPFELEPNYELYERSRNAMRLGQNLTVSPNDVVRDAVVIFGDARIAGHVTGNLLVWFGKAEIDRTAVIEGDFVAVGGSVTVQEGASVRRDLVVVGGPLDAPAGFGAGGGQIVIGSGMLGGSLNAVVPFLSRGLLWGRVIVPELPWIWGVLTLFFLLYAVLNLVFDRPVRACAATLQNRPLTTFGTGLLVLLLVGPVCVLLAVSIIGIAVVPFVICAVIAGGMIGKVSVARLIGLTAVAEDPDGGRASAARSFVIGFAVLTIAYMIPLLGILTWGIAGVMGLGSAMLTFMSAYRRENPREKTPAMVPPSPMPPPVMPPPAPPFPASSAAFDASAGATPVAPPPFEAAAPPQGGAYAAYAPAAYATSGLLVAQPRALFRDRLAAFIVDLIAVGMVAAFLGAIFDFDGPGPFFPLLLVYYIVFWTWKQTTFGGLVCQLRLVRADGMPLSFADSLVRGLAGIFSLLVFGLGALWIIRDPERQAWHDKIAGTYVVKVPRTWSL
jgi:uncharacterized RDD family membrane protein YckC